MIRICSRVLCALLVVGAVCASLLAFDAEAGILSRAVVRGAERSLGRGADRSAGRAAERAAIRNLRRDATRDAGTAAKPLARSRTAFRYVSQKTAKRELRSGIASGSHLTSHAESGRPLSAPRAMRRYGLAAKPQTRETVRLAKGTRVKLNRAVAGERGVGEIRASQRIPKSAIKKLARLN